MRRKYPSVELTEQRMALTVIKTSEETYKKCMERLRSMEIPKGWQVEVCTVQGGCAAGARNSGMKAVNAPKSPTPISNGGLTLTPPGYFPGSAKGGVSQYHFYWQPPLEAILPALTPPSYPSLPDS